MHSEIETATRDIEAQDLFSDPRAMYHLALYYLGYVRGASKNLRVAVYWLRRAAALGFAPAVFELGKCYSRGLGVPANELLACEQYQRCKRLAGFSMLSHDQRKTIEDGVVRLGTLKREAMLRIDAREREEALKHWRDTDATLRSAFPDAWRWQKNLMRMFPKLTCCLAHKSLSEESIVSAAIHCDDKTHTVVVFVETSFDWISKFDSVRIRAGITAPLTCQSVIVRPSGIAPTVRDANTSCGFSLQFTATQRTNILFPWHGSDWNIFSNVARWVLWSTVDRCLHYSVGFDSSKEAYDYLNQTFPWDVNDLPHLLAHPEQTAQIFIHNPQRSSHGESSVSFVPNIIKAI